MPSELLAQLISLSSLRELIIRVGDLERYDLFLLRSLLPCLHTLRMTSYRLDYGEVVETYPEPPESCPTPACSLVRLSIIGNMHGGFVHLPLLLQNSHSTLRELYVEHLGDKEPHPTAELVGQSIAEALAHCANLRDLALCCHDIELAPILSLETYSRSLRRLTLPRWPYDDELAAIPPGVRALGIYDMSRLPPAYLPSLECSEPWHDLQPVTHLPLAEFLVVSASSTLDGDQRRTSLKTDCAQRRVKLTWITAPPGMPALSWLTWSL